MCRVAILMTTYNGEKYIKEQIDSIIAQTFTDWNLYISDDGSKDRTKEIVYSYHDDRIKLFRKNTGIHGACPNYFNLMAYLKAEALDDYDYFFYCDQDDIWNNDKIEIEIDALRKYNGPALVYSDLKLMDKDGIETGSNMSDYTEMVLNTKYNLFFKHRYIWGTAMAHNRKLWDLVVIPDDSYVLDISHDNWLGKIAVIFGDIEYIKQPLLLYRRHGNNASGMPREHSLSKISLISFINYYAFIAKTSVEFLENQVSDKNVFKDDYLNCVNHGGLKAIRFFRKYDISVTDGTVTTLVFKWLFITRIITIYTIIFEKVKRFIYHENKSGK